MSFRKKKDKAGEPTAAIVEAKSAVVRNQADLLSQLSSGGGFDSIFGDEPESNSPPEPAPIAYSCPVPGPRAEIKPTVPKPVPVSVPTVGLPKISIPSAAKPPTVEYGAPVPGPPKAIPSVSIPSVSVPPVVVKVAIPSVSVPSVSVPSVSIPSMSVPVAASLPPPVFSAPQPEPAANLPPPKETPALSSSGSVSSLPAPPARVKKNPAPPPPTNFAPDVPAAHQEEKEEPVRKEPEEPEKAPSPKASPEKSETTRTASPAPPPKPRSFKPSPSSPAIISSALASSSNSPLSPRQSEAAESTEEVAQPSPRPSSPRTPSPRAPATSSVPGDRNSWGWTKPKENARASTPTAPRLQLGKQSSSALGRSSKEMNEEASEAMTLLSNESSQTENATAASETDLEQYKVGYCIYDYDIMNEGEIELKNGDYVIVMQETGEWLYVRCGESYGYVAASYVQIISEDTLHEQSTSAEEASSPLGSSNEAQSAPSPRGTTRDPSPKRGTASSLQMPVTMYDLRQRAMSITRPVLTPSGGASSGLTPSSPPQSPQISRAPPISAVEAKNKKLKKGTTFGSFRGLKKKKKEPEFEFQITRVETPASPLQSSASTSALMTNSGPLPDSIPHSSSTPSLAQSGSVDVLTRSDPSPEHTFPVEDVDQRTKIAREILSTEEHYVNILDALLKKYRDPLRAKVTTEGFGVTDQQIKDIFSNLHLILPINQELLEELRTKVKNEWSDSQSIGDTFARVAPFLKMYNQYGNNYNNALQTFNRCMQKPMFVAAVEECDSNTNISTRLDGLLITPVQRLPRYLMLLTEIKRHTPEGHPDHAFLDKAIPAMQEVADHVNNYIRQSENQLKLMELSVKGAQSLLKPHRSLISESILSDESKKRKVHIYVFNDILVHLSEAKAKNKANLTKNENQWPWHLVWIDPDPIAGLSSSSGSKKADCVEVIGPTGSYLLKSLTQATALEDSQKWKTLFQQTIVQHLEHLNVTQDPELQFEKDAKMRQDRPERYGSFVFPESGGSYTGWWLNGLMHGEGTFKFYNMTYEGGFHLNKKHGYGVLTYTTGETYQGQWAADKQNGAGTFTYQNGDVYVGHWKDGKKSGKGELTCKNGEHYTGDWLDDVPDGLGEMRYANNTVYTGNWKMGLRDMYGILISFGQKYEGQFELGTISGKGRMEWADGTVYDGIWKDGLKHGTGTYTSPIFGKYVGEWAFDCKEGKGTQEYPDGTIYNGVWKRNMYNGAGSLTFSSGILKAYKGEFVNNSRHGRGVLDLANGDNYEGHFKDNHMHGNGVYRWASGATLEAKFTRDKPDGKCTFTPPLIDDGSKKKKKVKEEKKAILYTGDYCDGMIFASEGPPIYIPSFPVIEINFRP